MQQILRFGAGIKEYMEGFGSLRVTLPERCAKCGCGKFYRWGKYERNITDGANIYPISIRRACCAKCRGTVSYLPDFCLSRIQYAVSFVMRLLQWLLTDAGAVLEPADSQEHIRRRGYAYRRRFEKGESLWLTFLRGRGLGKILGNVRERCKEIFSKLWELWCQGELLSGFNRETGRHFMAG